MNNRLQTRELCISHILPLVRPSQAISSRDPNLIDFRHIGCQETMQLYRLVIIQCKYLQPVYSHWLCYMCHCKLAVTVIGNESTHEIK